MRDTDQVQQRNDRSTISFAAGAFLALGVLGTALPRVVSNMGFLSDGASSAIINAGWLALIAGVCCLAFQAWRISNSHESATGMHEVVVDLRTAEASIAVEPAAPITATASAAAPVSISR